MFIISTIIGALMAGMGIGGGSIFVLLLTLFGVANHKEAIIYNLI